MNENRFESFLQFSNRPRLLFSSDWQKLENERVLVNLGDLHRVLSNLVNNAAEAISDSGTISILVRDQLKTISISVVDSGRGMSKELISSLGLRGISDKSIEGSGFGLGLSHAFEAISKMNGTWNITSKEEMGTIITLNLRRELGE